MEGVGMVVVVYGFGEGKRGQENQCDITSMVVIVVNRGGDMMVVNRN